MRKRVLALAFAAAISLGFGAMGCKHSGSKLEGRWRGTRADGVGAAQGAANAFATRTEIIAHGNMITVSTPGSKAQPTAFVVDSETNAVVVVHTDKDGAANKETFSFSEDAKTMTWRLGEGRTITFQKQKD